MAKTLKIRHINDLRKKYPKILKCGLDCSDGWIWLIGNLCSQLQWDADKNNCPQIVATQIKEKFGSLRFYFTSIYDKKPKTLKEKFQLWLYNALIDIMRKYCREQYYDLVNYGRQEGKIELAEFLSYSICEKCGSHKGKERKINGWLTTLCEECYKERCEKEKI